MRTVEVGEHHNVAEVAGGQLAAWSELEPQDIVAHAAHESLHWSRQQVDHHNLALGAANGNLTHVAREHCVDGFDRELERHADRPPGGDVVELHSPRLVHDRDPAGVVVAGGEHGGEREAGATPPRRARAQRRAERPEGGRVGKCHRVGHVGHDECLVVGHRKDVRRRTGNHAVEHRSRREIRNGRGSRATADDDAPVGGIHDVRGPGLCVERRRTRDERLRVRGGATAPLPATAICLPSAENVASACVGPGVLPDGRNVVVSKMLRPGSSDPATRRRPVGSRRYSTRPRTSAACRRVTPSVAVSCSTIRPSLATGREHLPVGTERDRGHA